MSRTKAETKALAQMGEMCGMISDLINGQSPADKRRILQTVVLDSGLAPDVLHDFGNSLCRAADALEREQ